MASEHNLVSRAGDKLLSILMHFNLNFRDKIILDVGSSTGGFTQIALNLGASQVFAVEKGTNQMSQVLRLDPRLTLMEKTDILDINSGVGPSVPTPDIILVDVSFTSIIPILKALKTRIAGPDSDLIILLKPQFEARADELHKGIVKNDKTRRLIIKDFEQRIKPNFKTIAKIDSAVSGLNGNQERFYHLRLYK